MALQQGIAKLVLGKTKQNKTKMVELLGKHFTLLDGALRVNSIFQRSAKVRPYTALNAKTDSHSAGLQANLDGLLQTFPLVL